jgi:hypothetical protein
VSSVRLTGTFRVTGGTDEPYETPTQGLRLTHASGTQRWEGDIEGDGAVHWLMAFRPDGSARFVGLQRFSGTLLGRSGSWVATATGDHADGASRIQLEVVPGSGTDRMRGITGTGALEAPGGPEGTYLLEVTLPD